MIIFTPPGNGTSPCSGVVQYGSNRATADEYYFVVTWVVFGVGFALWLLGFVVFFLAKNEAGMRDVGPFYLDIIACASSLLLIASLGLSAIYKVPCYLALIGLVLGVTGNAMRNKVRLLMFVVKSQFEKDADDQTMRLVITTNTAAGSESGDHQDSGQVGRASQDDDLADVTGTPALAKEAKHLNHRSFTSFIVSNVKMVLLALGLFPPDKMLFQDLACARRSTFIFVLVLALPAFIVIIVVIVTVPQYHVCVGCGFFWEVIIGLLVVLVPNNCLSITMLSTAWRGNYPDRHGTFRESLLVSSCMGLIAAIGVLLLIFDPDDKGFNRDFAFEWIWGVGLIISFCFVCGPPLRSCQRRASKTWCVNANDKAKHGRISSISVVSLSAGEATIRWSETGTITTFLSDLDRNQRLRDRFVTYMKSRYAVENLYFVDDVQAFKRYYDEKAKSWRQHKALFLMKTYILPYSPMEINISEAVKSRAKNNVEGALNLAGSHHRQQLLGAFDEAVEDITRNILRGFWLDFCQDDKALLGRCRDNITGSVHSVEENPIVSV